MTWFSVKRGSTPRASSRLTVCSAAGMKTAPRLRASCRSQSSSRLTPGPKRTPPRPCGRRGPDVSRSLAKGAGRGASEAVCRRKIGQGLVQSSSSLPDRACDVSLSGWRIPDAPVRRDHVAGWQRVHCRGELCPQDRHRPLQRLPPCTFQCLSPAERSHEVAHSAARASEEGRIDTQPRRSAARRRRFRPDRRADARRPMARARSDRDDRCAS